MAENTTAKVLKGIGVAMMIICFIGAMIIASETTNEIIIIAFIVSGIISGTTFIGFGEIINLLQKNVNKQDAIISYLQTSSNSTNNQASAPKSVLQDIEANLPQI